MSVAATLVLLVGAVAGCNAASSGQPDGGEASPHALILISLDGFRWDYQQLTETPNIDALAKWGVQAERLIPAFPSKTFPSHYTTVTGLYPGEHGIVSNNMRDPRWDGEFHLGSEELLKGRWWGGEPIWTTAHRHGLVTASYFWPGSEVLINDDRPDYYYAYDGSVPYQERVDQVLAWLDLPESERPSFITLYFGDPNDTAHDFGPESREALAAVRRVDDMIGRLVKGVEARGVLASTDIVLTADHGMAEMPEDRVIVLDRYVELLEDEVFEGGAFLQIYPAEGRETELLSALQGAHPNLHVWARDEIPERYRLAGNPRLAPIVGVPDVGWTVTTRIALRDVWGRVIPGQHGGDPLHPDMAGIFIASGPSFARGARVPAFENVEIYNLLAGALGIEPARNSGDLSRVPGILR